MCPVEGAIDDGAGQALNPTLLNDTDTIFQVLSHPEFPLTDNATERALRYRLILRKLGLGTCRWVRQPWHY